MKVLTFFTVRGGSGKTVLSAAFASYVSYILGKRAMVLDFDGPEYNLYNMRLRELSLMKEGDAECDRDGLYIVEKVETVSGFTSRPINSFICSYTGRANMGDAEKYIESIHVYSSGTKGISLQMMSVGDTFTVDFQQNFPDPTYAKAFLTESSKMGLSAHCSDVIAYTTPKDHTANTNFIKSLAGFFKRIILR